MQIQKRNGTFVEFDSDRIINAINKAAIETIDGIDEKLSKRIADSIKKDIIDNNEINTVEQIQDLVESKLMASNRKDVAKKYILYREYRNQSRNRESKYKLLDDEFISKYKHLPNPMSPLGEFVYYRTYSRWLPEEKRREYWWETCRRAVEFNCQCIDNVPKEEAYQLYDNMYNLRQFLSGRTMWVGLTDVAKQYGIANYNCSFAIIDDFTKFKDLFYILMVGSGFGFRILKSDVNKLPMIKTQFNAIHEQYTPISKYKREDNTSITFIKTVAQMIIGDSKEGWAQALDFFLKILYEKDYKNIDTIIINYNNVRPKGEKLKRFGGAASGYESLKNMFEKITLVLQKLGRETNSNYCKLRPIQCLDIANIIGENVVVGGVRRTAEAGLIDSDDQECIESKAGLYYQDVNNNWIENKGIAHRKMSNNSIFYNDKPTREQLNWQIKQMRYSGEPAFVNATAAKKRRKDFKGLNPCFEILLDDYGLCNLTTINILAFCKNGMLDLNALLEAQKLSVKAGLRMTCLPLELHKWHNTQVEDRLLGCSLTGWQDAMNTINYDIESQTKLLKMLNNIANVTAVQYAQELNVQTPKLVCTIKPEGTISQLPSVSSGVHFSHSPYYIRRVRINATDPLVKVCEELNYPVTPENGQDWETCNTKVISFPVKSPIGKTKYDVSAIEQLEMYKMFQENYTDHNTSITVHVRDFEWDLVEQWLWDNWDSVVAVSFLSLDDNFYPQAPYESITEEEYNKHVSEMKPFIPSLISQYEIEEEEIDVGSSECQNGVCPIR
jgi:ribonucleoside-diphosphate reductase alpha chain/ribonucleoside-triphosphate reductase